MKNFTNQIHKIKSTLGEIKNNIEKMQLVTIIKKYNNFQTKGKTLTKKAIKRKYKSIIRKRNIPYEENKKEKDLNQINFKTQKINKIYISNISKYFDNKINNSNITKEDISNTIINKKTISTPILYDDNIDNNKSIIETIDNDDIILNYQIQKIQKEIDIIKGENNSLLNKLKTEKEKNTALNNLISEKCSENFLLEISKYFEVENYEDIPYKLNEMTKFLLLNNNNKENSAKNAFISNLKEIYRKENNIKDIKDNNSDINMKILWRWIKYLINKNKKIKNEINKNASLLNNIEVKNNFYKNTCEEIMNIYDIKNINQFEEFIHSLINKKNINKKRMDQLKKMLSEDDNNK